MKEASLFKFRKIVYILYGLMGLLLIALYLFSSISTEAHSFSLGIIFITSCFLNFYQLRKFYFKYDEKSIVWKLPNGDEENQIDLSEENYSVSRNWKGLTFTNENHSFDISLNYLWKGERKRLARELQSFYS